MKTPTMDIILLTVFITIVTAEVVQVDEPVNKNVTISTQGNCDNLTDCRTQPAVAPRANQISGWPTAPTKQQYKPPMLTAALSADSSSSGSGTAAPAEVMQQPKDVIRHLSVGLLVPHTTFRVREYSRAVISAMTSLRKQELTFLNAYKFQSSDIYMDMLKVNPSPTGIIIFLCL